MTKSHITDLISLLLIGLSFVVPITMRDPLLYTGLFALSGAVTNQLAIHMLFEKVPGLYGSGVIEKNFDRFKESIKSMVMEQFFTPERLRSFFAEEEKRLDLAPLVASADFAPAFDALSSSVMESSFGSMVQMIGGEKALEALREPFTRKLKSAVVSIVDSDAFKAQIDHYLAHSALAEDMIEQIDALVGKRLDELSPAMVKALVFDLIHEHLGWLVVWGGVFGGLIGFFSSFII